MHSTGTIIPLRLTPACVLGYSHTLSPSPSVVHLWKLAKRISPLPKSCVLRYFQRQPLSVSARAALSPPQWFIGIFNYDYFTTLYYSCQYTFCEFNISSRYFVIFQQKIPLNFTLLIYFTQKYRYTLYIVYRMYKKSAFLLTCLLVYRAKKCKK